jgi:hypothetical protein
LPAILSQAGLNITAECFKIKRKIPKNGKHRLDKQKTLQRHCFKIRQRDEKRLDAGTGIKTIP